MRTPVLSFLVTAAALVAAAAGNSTFDGKWQVRQNIAGNENSQTCTFTRNGNELAGASR